MQINRELLKLAHDNFESILADASAAPELQHAARIVKGLRARYAEMQQRVGEHVLMPMLSAFAEEGTAAASEELRKSWRREKDKAAFYKRCLGFLWTAARLPNPAEMTDDEMLRAVAKYAASKGVLVDSRLLEEEVE